MPTTSSANPSSQATTASMHTRSSTTDESDPGYDWTDALIRLGNEMSSFFVGPIHAQDFLNHFLPASGPFPSPHPKFTKGIFNDLIALGSENESKWYDVFIEIISPHVSNLNIVNTSNASDKAMETKFLFGLKPDCSVYVKDKYIGKDLDFSLVDFIIEFKKNLDPFVDPNSPENLDPEPVSGSSRSAGPGLDILGQITTYATSILSTQYCTHTFMVFIVNNYARLIQWDRSGAVVTERIYFNMEPHLFDFLMRYNIAHSKARGHDSTVNLPNDNEIALARRAVPELADAEAESFLAVDTSESDRRYIICRPELRPRIPVGRWTRTSFAYGIKEKRRVLLKDSWRILEEGVKAEGDIYDELEKEQVPNIPRCLFSSDVGDDTYYGSQTDKVINLFKYIPTPLWKLTPHRHYRIVLGTIGRKLEEFKSTKEFVTAMFAALKAHEAAYRAGVLHWDISARNILIVGEEELNSEDAHKSKIDGGMLIDWDLSKPVNPDDTTAHQYTRTGTWLFMATDLVECPDIPQTLEHDLESFFWVLLWIVLTQVPCSWSDESRSDVIDTVMNPRMYGRRGSSTKMTFLTNAQKLSKEDFDISNNRRLRKLLAAVKRVVAARHHLAPERPDESDTEYDSMETPDQMQREYKKYEEGLTLLKNHDRMLHVFEIALSGQSNVKWPTNDPAKYQGIMPSQKSGK